MDPKIFTKPLNKHFLNSFKHLKFKQTLIFLNNLSIYKSNQKFFGKNALTPSHGGGICQVPCLGPRSGPMLGATQWSHAWDHAVVPTIFFFDLQKTFLLAIFINFQAKMSNSIVWRGYRKSAWWVYAQTHQRPGRGPYQLLKGESQIHPWKADMDPFLGAGGTLHKPSMRSRQTMQMI